MQDDTSSKYRVVPFGNPRIKGHLHLPAAYRSLSRPSSPPRAKASTVCPCLLSLSLTLLPFIAKIEARVGLIYLQLALFFCYLTFLKLSNTSKIFFYHLRSLSWRITDSNRWPPACKAGALASWANPPSYKWKTESGKWKIRRVPDFQFSIFSFQLWSSPRQSWTADLYIISVAL